VIISSLSFLLPSCRIFRLRETYGDDISTFPTSLLSSRRRRRRGYQEKEEGDISRRR